MAIKVSQRFLFFPLLLLTSCCSIQVSKIEENTTEKQLFIESSRNIVKITASHKIEIIDKETDKSIKKATLNTIGTGTIIKRINNKSIILTAGHLCDVIYENQVLNAFEFFDIEKHKVLGSTDVLITNQNNIDFIAEVVKFDRSKDLCVLSSETPFEYETIIGNNLKRYDPVFYYGFVLGLFGYDFIPLYEGRFIGLMLNAFSVDVQAYTFPTANGASGGSVYNTKGELVGIVHTFMKSYHHLTMGATLEDIKSILQQAEKSMIKSQE